MSLTFSSVQVSSKHSSYTSQEGWLQVDAKVSLPADHGGGLLRVQVVVLNAEGLPLLIDDIYEEPVAPGKDARISAMAKHYVSMFDVKAQLRGVFLAAEVHDLGRYKVEGMDCIFGSSEPVDLGHGIQLHRWSFVVGDEDEDGDVPLLLLGVMERTEEKSIAQVGLQMALLKPSGKELETLKEEAKGLAVGQLTGLNGWASCGRKWFKKALKLRCTATVYTEGAHGVSGWVPVG